MFDITERKLAEERLQKAEANYRTLVEQLPVVVYQDAVDDVSTALYISPQYERLFGFPPGARLRNPQFWVDHLHPEDRDRVLELSKWTNETGEPFSAEYRFIGRDGRVVWVRDEAELLHDADGEPTPRWQGVLLDVTARKHAEEALSRRDLVLQAIGFAAERFLKSDDWAAALPDVLERLGTASSAGRVYVFENVPLEYGCLGMRRYRQWFGSDTAEIDGGVTTLAYDDGFARWRSVLSEGRELHGLTRDFPEQERPHLEDEGVLSQIVVPVSVGDAWWGFIGFDDYATDASGRPPRSRRSRQPPTRSAPRSDAPAPNASVARSRPRGRSSSSGPAPSWLPRSRRSSRWTSAAGSWTSTRRPSGVRLRARGRGGRVARRDPDPAELRERHRGGSRGSSRPASLRSSASTSRWRRSGPTAGDSRSS